MTKVAITPLAAITVRITRWASCSSGCSQTVPSASERPRSTPCHSGNSQAMTRSGSGSAVIGKNVPEKRNSGVIPNRQIELNEEVSPLG